ncbi:MAG TPA: pitrilysin family protein [Polyangia bacterium]|jgi:zinc protease
MTGRALLAPALVLATGMAMAGAARAEAAAPVAPAKVAVKSTGKSIGKVKGMPRTVFVPSPMSPLVALRVFFHVGSADDPAGKEGLAALTSDVVGQGGTRKRTYSEMLDALYPLAARIQVVGDVESIVFEGTVHRDNLAAFADLMVEQILEPRFADEDFTRQRQNALDFVTKSLRGNDDEELGKHSLASLMYAGHPYGHPAPGTATALGAVTVDDVKKFYATHFTRDRLIVGVAGGYPAGFAEAFAARFAALPARGQPLPTLPKPKTRKGAEVLIVEKDARADAISLGFPIAVTRADADFYPLTVARSYLGEHRTFNGVLMNRLRADRGLNYGDYAYIENFIQDGWSTFPYPNIPRRQQHFEIWLRPVPPQNALFALRGAVYYTRQLIEKGIPEEGFQSTRRFLLNYADLWTQDVSRRLGYAIDAAVYGKDLVKELKTRLAKMTKADVDRAVRKHLQLDNFAVAIVADKAADVKARLLDGKPTPITYDTGGTPAAILEEDKLIEKEPLPITADSVRVVSADQMFEK